MKLTKVFKRSSVGGDVCISVDLRSKRTVSRFITYELTQDITRGIRSVMIQKTVESHGGARTAQAPSPQTILDAPHPQAHPTAAPMRCTETLCSDTGNTTTAPVVTTRVQHREADATTYLTLDNNSHTLPQPSAPSPGHLFYNSEDRSDITFIVGQEEWRFPAHSFILGKTQSTLSALLKAAQGSQADELQTRLDLQSEPVTPVVLKLSNMQPEVFEQILRYIYTGQITFLTVDSTLRLLHPSRIYHLPLLTTHCLKHISTNVNTSNVLIVLSHLLCPEIHHPSDDTLEECHDNDNERNELVFQVLPHRRPPRGRCAPERTLRNAGAQTHGGNSEKGHFASELRSSCFRFCDALGLQSVQEAEERN
ncbi:hypothetical protein CEXT_727371 [Caerostris extrusa]|uniref:BTB domain-containing protein n=1 Tax=Caerostris extrusa TaxID=172846 RepID=A0AAV4U3P7_CAEEX|nr:hypothetical protein CEXT_727371 [Caerostris extrusa]